MRSAVRLSAGFLLANALLLLPPARPQAGGVPPGWEVRKDIGALAAGVARLKPVLEQVRPKDWVSRGAPEAYIGQWQTIRTEIEYLERSARILIEEPDRLTAALDTFFRLDRLQAMLASLEEGIRRYQNPALADLMRTLFTESASGRESLRQYLMDLAEIKEQEFKVADQEAQRCRAWLIRQPPARPSSGSPKSGTGSQERP